MRKIHDKLQYCCIVVVHTEADGIPTCRGNTGLWNTAISGEFDFHQIPPWKTISWQSDSKKDFRQRIWRNLCLSTQGHRRFQLVLINFKKRGSFCIETTFLNHSYEHNGSAWNNGLQLARSCLSTWWSVDFVLQASGIINKPRYWRPEWSAWRL